MKELPIANNDFIPCRTCSNILTKECLDDCVQQGEYKHYRQVPGTDIVDLPPFPLEDVLNNGNPRWRLMAIGIYLTAIVDYLQHMDEYKVNRIYYKSTGASWEDYSI
jgi:hypothetical protein